MTTALSVFTEYCKRNAKSDAVRDLAFSFYCQHYETLSDDKSMSPETIKRILLSEPNLVAHIRTAEDNLNAEIKKNEARIRREMAIKGFFINALSGVIGNIMYSLLLLLIFFLARDQIASWLSSVSPPKP